MSDRYDLATRMAEYPNKHIDAVAWDLFEESHSELFDTSTLGYPSSQFLRNRIASAFQAGVKHGRETKG